MFLQIYSQLAKKMQKNGEKSAKFVAWVALRTIPSVVPRLSRASFNDDSLDVCTDHHYHMQGQAQH